mmetsp:Transcript_23213/g.51238  ORF Transcript_23213/g.51238 Transcript_23213/m.51238 type:complete len:302 (-) Transcript_23213:1730-2635(-)
MAGVQGSLAAPKAKVRLDQLGQPRQLPRCRQQLQLWHLAQAPAWASDQMQATVRWAWDAARGLDGAVPPAMSARHLCPCPVTAARPLVCRHRLLSFPCQSVSRDRSADTCTSGCSRQGTSRAWCAEVGAAAKARAPPQAASVSACAGPRLPSCKSRLPVLALSAWSTFQAQRLWTRRRTKQSFPRRCCCDRWTSTLRTGSRFSSSHGQPRWARQRCPCGRRCHRRWGMVRCCTGISWTGRLGCHSSASCSGHQAATQRPARRQAPCPTWRFRCCSSSTTLCRNCWVPTLSCSQSSRGRSSS